MTIKAGMEVTILKNGKHGRVLDCYLENGKKVYAIECIVLRKYRKKIQQIKQRFQCRAEEIEPYKGNTWSINHC